jgi:hypothetical protein
MNLFDVGHGRNEERAKHRRAPAVCETDVMVVGPTARALVVDRTTELDGDGCTDCPRIGARFELQHGLVNVRRAFAIHHPRVAPPQRAARRARRGAAARARAGARRAQAVCSRRSPLGKGRPHVPVVLMVEEVRQDLRSATG